MLHRVDPLLAFRLTLVLRNSAQNRKREASAGRQRQQHTLLIDQGEPVPRGTADGQTRKRDGHTLFQRNGNTVGPDAHDGGLAHPIHGKKMAAAFGKRDLENALTHILSEHAQNARHIRMNRTVNLDPGARRGKRLAAAGRTWIAAQDEPRIVRQERFDGDAAKGQPTADARP